MAIVPVIKTKNDNTDIPDVLTTKCDAVSKVDDEVKQIAQDLIETARDAKVAYRICTWLAVVAKIQDHIMIGTAMI